MPLKQTPDIARRYLLWAALLLALPGALSLYSRYQGQVLVALPKMENTPVFMIHIDQREGWPKVGIIRSKPHQLFLRTVILIEQHNGWGASGLILNKPLPDEEKAKFPIEKQGFNWKIGGPVGYPDTAFVLVKDKTSNNASSPPKLMSLSEFTQKYPDEWRAVLSDAERKRGFTIYLGLSNWGSLQLDREFRLSSWGTTDYSKDMIEPGANQEEIWRKALRKVIKETPPLEGKI